MFAYSIGARVRLLCGTDGGTGVSGSPTCTPSRFFHAQGELLLPGFLESRSRHQCVPFLQYLGLRFCSCLFCSEIGKQTFLLEISVNLYTFVRKNAV